MNIEKYQYKTELHLHTSPASGCSEIPPELAVKIYAGLGYHSIVICNHFYDYLLFGIDREFFDAAYEVLDMGIEEFSKEFRDDGVAYTDGDQDISRYCKGVKKSRLYI